jgi:hypothetical protein
LLLASHEGADIGWRHISMVRSPVYFSVSLFSRRAPAGRHRIRWVL